jgi:hypothetical protein
LRWEVPAFAGMAKVECGVAGMTLVELVETSLRGLDKL